MNSDWIGAKYLATRRVGRIGLQCLLTGDTKAFGYPSKRELQSLFAAVRAGNYTPKRMAGRSRKNARFVLSRLFCLLKAEWKEMSVSCLSYILHTRSTTLYVIVTQPIERYYPINCNHLLFPLLVQSQLKQQSLFLLYFACGTSLLSVEQQSASILVPHVP